MANNEPNKKKKVHKHNYKNKPKKNQSSLKPVVINDNIKLSHENLKNNKVKIDENVVSLSDNVEMIQDEVKEVIEEIKEEQEPEKIEAKELIVKLEETKDTTKEESKIELQEAKPIALDNFEETAVMPHIEIPEVEEVTEKVEPKQPKKRNKFSYVALILIFVVCLFVVSSLYSNNFAVTKIVNSIKNDLNIKDEESMSYQFNITATDNKTYAILNNSVLEGSYMSSNNIFDTNFTFTSSYGESINASLVNDGTKTIFNDANLYESPISFQNNKFDLSLNNMKNNIFTLVSEISKSKIMDYTKGYVENGNKIIQIRLTETNISNVVDELSKINLDSIYKTILSDLVEDMKENPKKYIGTDVKLYTKLLSGNFIKLEIRNNYLITVSKTNEGYNVEKVDTNSVTTKINITSNNISIIETTGSRTTLNINIDYQLTKTTYTSNNLVNDVDINSLDQNNQYLIKRRLSSLNTSRDLMSMYYAVTERLDILSMNVQDGEYLIYYEVPEGYNMSNYSGNTIKKYIDIDKTIIYSIYNYNDQQVSGYIDQEYNKDISSTFYYNVLRKSSETLDYNGLTYNYQIITKTYDSNYADYDTTSSVIYIWTRLNNNKVFMIEYEFQGADISEDSIKELLKIEIGS